MMVTYYPSADLDHDDYYPSADLDYDGYYHFAYLDHDGYREGLLVGRDNHGDDVLVMVMMTRELGMISQDYLIIFTEIYKKYFYSTCHM